MTTDLTATVVETLRECEVSGDDREATAKCVIAVVREAISAEIERYVPPRGMESAARTGGLRDAARIARGEAS